MTALVFFSYGKVTILGCFEYRTSDKPISCLAAHARWPSPNHTALGVPNHRHPKSSLHKTEQKRICPPKDSNQSPTRINPPVLRYINKHYQPQKHCFTRGTAVFFRRIHIRARDWMTAEIARKLIFGSGWRFHAVSTSMKNTDQPTNYPKIQWK